MGIRKFNGKFDIFLTMYIFLFEYAIFNLLCFSKHIIRCSHTESPLAAVLLDFYFIFMFGKWLKKKLVIFFALSKTLSSINHLFCSSLRSADVLATHTQSNGMHRDSKKHRLWMCRRGDRRGRGQRTMKSGKTECQIYIYTQIGQVV